MLLEPIPLPLARDAHGVVRANLSRLGDLRA
jgi:hypothetical protein